MSYASENITLQQRLEQAHRDLDLLKKKCRQTNEMLESVLEENERQLRNTPIIISERGTRETIDMRNKRYQFMKENVVDMYARSLCTDTEKKIEECPVCLDPLSGTSMCVLDCGHFVCRGCYTEVEKTRNRCPVCRYKITINHTNTAGEKDDDDESESDVNESGDDDEDDDDDEQEESDDDDEEEESDDFDSIVSISDSSDDDDNEGVPVMRADV